MSDIGLTFKITMAVSVGIVIGGGTWVAIGEIPPPPEPVLQTATAQDSPKPRVGKGQVRTRVTAQDGDTGEDIPGIRVNGRRPTAPLVGHPGRPLTVDAPGYPPQEITARAGTMTATLWRADRQSRVFGSTPGRTRVLTAVAVPTPGPRQKPAWSFGAGSLLEFPPAVAEGVVVAATNRGRVQALDAKTGAGLWQHKVGTVAASPAIANNMAYIADMKGEVIAYALDSGRERWRLKLGSPIETSPLLVDGTDLVVGTWDGRLLRIAGKTGRIQWTQRLAGEVKGAAALTDRDTIVVGDYSGTLWSLHKRTGRVVWRQDIGSRFYGGPAVMGNYAVIGDVGGEVIAVNTRDGGVRWRHGMDGYVYGSPAIYDGAAFIGSYAGRFERIDLDTGRVDWSFNAGQRISGSAYISGTTVYVATLYRPGESRHTFGLDLKTGAKRMDRPDGRYTAATSAGQTLYLIGVKTITAWPAR